MVVMGSYMGGREAEVKAYTYEPKDELEMGVTYVTISFGGKTCTQDITVSDEERTQTGIEVTTAPNKVNYVIGEKFDPTGMVVKKVYKDGYGAVVTDYTYTPTDELEETDDKITIKAVDLKQQPLSLLQRKAKNLLAFLLNNNQIKQFTTKANLSAQQEWLLKQTLKTALHKKFQHIVIHQNY